MWILFKEYCIKVWRDLEDYSDLGLLVLSIFLRIFCISICVIQFVDPEILGPFSIFKVPKIIDPEVLLQQPGHGVRIDRGWKIVIGFGKRVEKHHYRITPYDTDEVIKMRQTMKFCSELYHERLKEEARADALIAKKRKKDG